VRFEICIAWTTFIHIGKCNVSCVLEEAFNGIKCYCPGMTYVKCSNHTQGGEN